MGFGGSILLLAIGAILTFALNVQVGWLDLDVVGWVLMGAGALGLILTSWVWSSRRRAARTPVDSPSIDERTDVVGPPDPL